MKIKSITFFFENLDEISISGNYIGIISIPEERKQYFGNGEHIRMIHIAHQFYIEIHKDANGTYREFGLYKCGRNIFERLSYGDITEIEIEFKRRFLPNKIQRIHIDWNDENNYINFNQKSVVSSLGHLHILIDKHKTMRQVINQRTMNSEEDMKSHFE